MPTTSIEALSELQQRGIDTLKVVQSAQITTLRAARATATTTPPMLPILPMARYATDVAISLTYSIMAQQAAFAKRCLEAFAAPSATKAPQTAAAATMSEAAPAAIDAPPSVDSVPPEVSVGLALSGDAVAESGPPAILTPPFAEDVSHDIISASAATTALVEHLTADVVDAVASPIENAAATAEPIVETAAAAMATGEPVFETAAPAAEVSHELITATSVPSFSEAAAMNDGSVDADDDATGSSRPEIIIPHKVPAVSNNGMQPKRRPASKSKRPR